MLRRQEFWCARPEMVNDPEEFSWECDYKPTENTLSLLTEILVSEIPGRTREDARKHAQFAIESGRVQDSTQQFRNGIIKQCRDDFGLLCFGTSPNNSILWKRYANNGNGVCIELEVPEDLVGTQLQRVKYLTSKTIHIDQWIRAYLDPSHIQDAYSLVLLSKYKSENKWENEEEIRFISKQQAVSVCIDRSEITSLWLGDSLKADMRVKIRRLVDSLPYELQIYERPNAYSRLDQP